MSTSTDTADDTMKDPAAAVRAFLDALLTCDPAAVGSLLAPDAAIEFPFAPEGAPERVAGRDTIEEYFAKTYAAKTPIAFTDITTRPFADPDEVFCEFKSEMEVNETGRRYHNRYCAITRVGPDGIELFREWYDPAVDGELRTTTHAA